MIISIYFLCKTLLVQNLTDTRLGELKDFLKTYKTNMDSLDKALLDLDLLAAKRKDVISLNSSLAETVAYYTNMNKNSVKKRVCS